MVLWGCGSQNVQANGSSWVEQYCTAIVDMGWVDKAQAYRNLEDPDVTDADTITAGMAKEEMGTLLDLHQIALDALRSAGSIDNDPAANEHLKDLERAATNSIGDLERVRELYAEYPDPTHVSEVHDELEAAMDEIGLDDLAAACPVDGWFSDESSEEQRDAAERLQVLVDSNPKCAEIEVDE